MFIKKKRPSKHSICCDADEPLYKDRYTSTTENYRSRNNCLPGLFSMPDFYKKSVKGGDFLAIMSRYDRKDRSISNAFMYFKKKENQ